MKTIAEIQSEMIETLDKALAEIDDRLRSPVLDGCPWMVVAQGERGPMVLGEWQQAPDQEEIVRGFRHIDTVPVNLCDVVLQNEVGAHFSVMEARRHGYKAERVHVREFLIQRQKNLLEMRKGLSEGFKH